MTGIELETDKNKHVGLPGVLEKSDLTKSDSRKSYTDFRNVTHQGNAAALPHPLNEKPWEREPRARPKAGMPANPASPPPHCRSTWLQCTDYNLSVLFQGCGEETTFRSMC